MTDVMRGGADVMRGGADVMRGADVKMNDEPPRNCWRVLRRSGWLLRAIWLSVARGGKVNGDLLACHVIPRQPRECGGHVTL